jgi:hypothetical protein
MIVGWVCRGPVLACTGQTLRCTGQTLGLPSVVMSKKFMGLAFVMMTSGCHARSEGAVCPAPEQSAESEPLPEEVDVEMTPELEAEIKRAKRRMREEIHGIRR